MNILIEKNGTRTSVPEAELSFYLRMGYEKVEESAPKKSEPKKSEPSKNKINS